MNNRDLEDAHALALYPMRGITIVKGAGASLWDDTGKRYIDCTAGVGVANVGHGNEAVARALCEQAQRLITCPGFFHNDVRARLLEKLSAIAPPGLERAFLCNSGAESIEAALKFARHSTGKTDFVCAMRGFHGRTLGALSATFKKEFRADFQPLVPGFSFVPFNKFDPLREAVSDATAGILLEIIQGEGGVRIGERAYFEAVRELCDARGILLIVDEIQTGFCRTGRMFACEHFELAPDLLCLAKAMAGGMPMGAVLCNDKIKPAPGKHGSTFGGNPLACAAALAAIDYMEQHRLHEQAADKGAYFVDRFSRRLPTRVRELRQIGLMIGIELKEKATPYLARLLQQGVLALPAGPTVIRLLPPLVIDTQELDTVADTLLAVLAGE